MKKTTMFEPGYTLRVTTWENDGDNYNTVDFTVATANEALGFLAICDLCGRRSEFGNMYEPSESQVKKFHAKLECIFDRYFADLHPDIPEHDRADFLSDHLYDLGIGGSEYYYTRVVDKVKIFLVEQTIQVNEIDADELRNIES